MFRFILTKGFNNEKHVNETKSLTYYCCIDASIYGSHWCLYANGNY